MCKSETELRMLLPGAGELQDKINEILDGGAVYQIDEVESAKLLDWLVQFPFEDDAEVPSDG